MKERETSRKIEKLRLQMIDLAMEKGSFIDKNVIELSKQLDHLILQYQLLKEAGYITLAEEIKVPA
jgi:hypothetical protein